MCFATRSPPVCKWWAKLVDDSGGVVIRFWQDMTKLANMLLTNVLEDARLSAPPAEILIQPKNGPVHTFDRPEDMELKSMVAGGEGLAERPRLNIV